MAVNIRKMLLYFIVLALFALDDGECCTCRTAHPQTIYCSNYGFVVKATIDSDAEVRRGYWFYNVTVGEVFKTSNNVAINTNTEVMTSALPGMCGVENIRKGVTYLFTGMISEDQKLMINQCGFNKEYNSLSDTVKNGVKSKKYDCKCPICFNSYCNKNEQHCVLLGDLSDFEKTDKYCNHVQDEKNPTKGKCIWADASKY